jgi:outer membrane protein assembly factor BamD
MKRLILLFLVLVSLTGCAGSKKGHPGAREEKLSKLVARAQKEYRAEHWELAVETFRKIRDRYPDSPYALWAELKMADCKFFAQEYLEAIELYKEFEKLHPTNEAIPYVIYQIGTCYYKMILSPDRDQTYTQKAIENYERLLKAYPGSPYEEEVKRRIKKCREILGEHELYVARFYHKLKYYRAAYYRLLYLLHTYPDTEAARKAQGVLKEYEHKAQEETKKLSEGTLKDYWGQPIQ